MCYIIIAVRAYFFILTKQMESVEAPFVIIYANIF